MATYEVKVSETIRANGKHIYRVLSNYHTEHPRILPKPYFASLQVEEGGVGAGTKFVVVMKVMGITQTLRMTVTEPVPGRELQEEDVQAGVITNFYVEPLSDMDGHCKVTIRTVWRKPPGLRGWLEEKINPLAARSIFGKELLLIKAYCEEGTV